MPPLSSAAFALVAAGVLVATVVDLRTRRIPNTLTGAMALLGVGFAMAGLSGVTIGASVAGLVLGLALMMPGHLLGATGGGDVKLMGAIGAIVGPATIVNVFLMTAIAGGALAVLVAARRRRIRQTLANTRQLIARATGAGDQIRSNAANRFAYGPAIAAGSLLALLLG